MKLWNSPCVCPFWKRGYFQRAGCFWGLSLFIHSAATAEGRRQVTHGFCLRGRTDCNSELGTKSLYYLEIENINSIFFPFHFSLIPNFSSKGDWRVCQWQRHTLHIEFHTDLSSSFYGSLHWIPYPEIKEDPISMPIVGWANYLFLLHSL